MKTGSKRECKKEPFYLLNIPSQAECPPPRALLRRSVSNKQKGAKFRAIFQK